MSEAQSRERVMLGLPSHEAAVAVARLVLGGIGARLDLSYEALDELQLATELLLATLVKENAAETLALDVEWDDGELVLTAGPTALAPGSVVVTELRDLLSALGARLETTVLDGEPRLRAARPLARPAT